MFRPQPTRRQVIEVEIDAAAAINEAHLEATGAGHAFVLDEADHDAIEARRGRESNYRLLVSWNARGLLRVVGVGKAGGTAIVTATDHLQIFRLATFWLSKACAAYRASYGKENGGLFWDC